MSCSEYCKCMLDYKTWLSQCEERSDNLNDMNMMNVLLVYQVADLTHLSFRRQGLNIIRSGAFQGLTALVELNLESN